MQMAGAMLCALFCALFAGFAAPAHAQAISNTASASWSRSGQAFSTLSNTVAFEVAPVAVTIETFAAAATPTSLTFTPSRCGNTPILLGNGDAGLQVIAGVAPASKVRIGDAFFFRVTAPAENHDPTAIDRLETTLITSSGDRETVVIYETGPNTGTFVGGVPTAAIPPDASAQDCRLSVAKGDTISIVCRQDVDEPVLATAQLDVLADPFGYVFDSEDGSPVDGARVTLLNADTGDPATVFASDGQTRWPSSIITGQPIIDAAGNRYQLPPGEYRFPLAARGRYRLQVEPPAPYVAPSAASAAQLAGVTRPDGSALTLNPASTGGSLALDSPDAVRVDIPVDRPARAVTLSKSASRQKVQPGDLVFYTIVVANPDAAHGKRDIVLRDSPDPALRLRPGSLRIAGAPPGDAATFAPDGSGFTLHLGSLPPGGRRKITYAASIRPDAAPGAAQNRVTATDSRGLNAAAGAQVTAVDRSAPRLKRVTENLARLNLSAETVAADAGTWPDRRTFDAILLDAPCSATGTFRRHPDVLWAAKPGDIASLAAVQARLLDSATRRLKPGGRLVYCVCSLESEEGEAQVAGFLARTPGLALDTIAAGEGGAPAASVTSEGTLRILPHHLPGGTDGFYVARFRAA